jgi:hypothetical protein
MFAIASAREHPGPRHGGGSIGENELHLPVCDPVALSSDATEEVHHVRRLALKT